jgi:hypothetical protein
VIVLGATLVSGCGGGGGGTVSGNPVVNPPADNNQTVTRTIAGTVYTSSEQGGSRVASRIAEDIPVTNAALKAYNVTDATKTNLITAGGTTGANGVFSATITIPKNTTPSIVIETLIGPAGDAGNIKLALESVSANRTGLLADRGSTRKAVIFELIPDVALNTISGVDNLLAGEGIDATASVTNATRARELVNYVSSLLTACPNVGGNPDYNCIHTQIGNTLAATNLDAEVEKLVERLDTAAKVALGIASINEIIADLIEPDYSRAQVDKIVEVFTDAGESALNTLNNIDTKPKAAELCAAMSDVVDVWDAAHANTTAKRLAVKDMAMAIRNGEIYTYSDVYSSMGLLRSGMAQKISTNAAAAASTLTTSNDINSIISAYDIIRGMLIEVMVKEAGATREDAADAVEGLLEVLADLGESSNGTASFDAVMDNWVVSWADAALATNLMTALFPMEMDVRAKTDPLMMLARDIADLPPGFSDAQLEAVLLNYLSPATTASAMTLYNNNKGKNCQFGYTFPPLSITATDCPDKEEVISLIETHYEKDLPKLRAVVDGVEAWVNHPDNAINLLGLGNSFSKVEAVYNSMKVSTANKNQLSDALNIAGVKPELFWLAINLEPYM